MNEQKCYAKLLAVIHGRRSAWLYLSDPICICVVPPCPHCKRGHGRRVKRVRNPLIDYRCSRCRRFFNGWTGTVFQGTHRRPSELVLLIWGIVMKVPTARLARKLGSNRPWLVGVRRRIEQEQWLALLLKGQLAGIRLSDFEEEIDHKLKKGLIEHHRS
jgi:hypothetical protein